MIRYKKEFKQSLVEMHNQGRSYTDLSAEYGPSVDSIRNWVKLYAVHEVDGEKWTQADVNALQKENDKLREELEILKRDAPQRSKNGNQSRLQNQSWDLWLPPHRRIFTVHFEH